MELYNNNNNTSNKNNNIRKFHEAPYSLPIHKTVIMHKKKKSNSINKNIVLWCTLTEVVCFCSPHGGDKSPSRVFGLKFPPAAGRPTPSPDDSFLRGAAVLLTASCSDSSGECRDWGARHAAVRPRAVILILFYPRKSERDRWTPVSVCCLFGGER